MTLTAAEAIDTSTEVFGAHPGFRALHATGIVASGVFRLTREAANLSRAARLQGPGGPATVRFSNGSGNPRHPDYAPDPRGLAVKLYPPDCSRTDIVAMSTAVFPTRTPEGFIELLRAQAAGPAAAWKLPLFLRHHPGVAAGAAARGADARAAGQLRDDSLPRAARLPLDRRRGRQPVRTPDPAARRDDRAPEAVGGAPARRRLPADRDRRSR